MRITHYTDLLLELSLQIELLAMAESFSPVADINGSDLSLAEAKVSEDEIQASQICPMSLEPSLQAANPEPRAAERPSNLDHQCIVCFEEEATMRPCCSKYVCEACLCQMVRLSVTEGIVHIKCPSQECDKALTDKEVVRFIEHDRILKNKYDRFRLDYYVKDGNKKTCPCCCLITEYKLPRKLRLKENDVKVKCTSCDLEWCFKCHAPFHLKS